MVEHVAQISILCCHIAFSVKIVHHPEFLSGGIFISVFIKEYEGGVIRHGYPVATSHSHTFLFSVTQNLIKGHFPHDVHQGIVWL
jgi:hypothetical protein